MAPRPRPDVKRAQLRELLTGYGPIEFVWFDHAIGDGGLSHAKTAAPVKSLQPRCLVGFNSGAQDGADLRIGERGKAAPLDVGPDRSGRLRAIDVARLRKVGAMIRSADEQQ